MRNFLKEELDSENAENIEFQRAHRIGKKKTGEARPVIIRFEWKTRLISVLTKSDRTEDDTGTICSDF